MTIFFSIGIFLSDTLLRSHNYLSVHIIFLSILLLLSILFYFKRLNLLFGIFISLFSLIFGSLLTNIKWMHSEHEWAEDKCSYYGEIIGEVLDKGLYIQFPVYVNQNNVIVRVIKDSVSLNYRDGDVVIFYGKIKRPSNMGNPNEIDYASYLLHNDFNGTIFLQDDEIKKINHHKETSISEKSVVIRNKVIDIFKGWGISGDELALLSALMVGERELFSEEVENDYTKSGLSHILSISGMHVGILLLIVNYLLWFMKSNGFLRIIKWFILAIALWAFAFISGLAPSAVRAVIMCLCLELMFFSHEKRNPLNIIFFTALCMLIYNPFYLFDISFQLSFAAVISIILFYSSILSTLRCRFKVVNSFSSIIALSISAQIGAAPLVLYYFSNFSTYFLISNILSAFLIVIIMVVAMLSFLIPLKFLYLLLNLALSTQNKISSTVASFPNSIIRIDNFSLINTLFIYLLFIILLLYISNRRRKYIVGLTVVILCFLSFNMIKNIPNNVYPHALIYSDSKKSYIHFVENRDKSLVVCSNNDSIKLQQLPVVRRYCYKNGIKEPQIICDVHNESIYSRDGIILWRGKKFCVISDKRWKNRFSSTTPLEIDYLYINRGYYGSIATLEKVFKIKKIILGFSLSDNYIETITKECVRKGISLVNLKEIGYYKIMI